MRLSVCRRSRRRCSAQLWLGRLIPNVSRTHKRISRNRIKPAETLENLSLTKFYRVLLMCQVVLTQVKPLHKSHKQGANVPPSLGTVGFPGFNLLCDTRTVRACPVELDAAGAHDKPRFGRGCPILLHSGTELVVSAAKSIQRWYRLSKPPSATNRIASNVRICHDTSKRSAGCG